LANLPPGGAALAEEAIPLAFRPVGLNSALLAIRRLLFATDPDRAMINYRVRQFLTALHASPWEPYLLDLDPRITYATGADATLAQAAPFTPLVVPLGAAWPPPAVVGSAAAPDAVGRLAFEYEVTVTAADSAGVLRVQPYRRTYTLPFTVADGLSSEVPLPGSGYALRLGGAGLTVGAAWRVTFHLRPTRDPADAVAAAGRAGQPVLVELFGTGRDEPYRTFRNLFAKGREGLDRLAGLVLALVYRTEEARRG